MSAGDSALHGAIRAAEAAGRVAVEVNYTRANRNRAPGYRTTDLVVPWFVNAASSIYLGATYGWAMGIASFAVLAALILLVLRPINRRRAEERYRTMGLSAPEHWDALWRLGGLTLRGPGGTIDSPDGDWRAAARALSGEAS